MSIKPRVVQEYITSNSMVCSRAWLQRRLMIGIGPLRAALGFATTILVSSLAIEARAQDASPWQRDGHSAVRLLAGSRSGAVLLGGIAFELQPGWKTYWRTPGDFRVAPRLGFSKLEKN